MTRTRLSVVAIASVAAAAAAFAAPGADAQRRAVDLTGSWTIHITTEQGEFRTHWDLVQHADGTLTGEIEGRRGYSPARGGWVKGDGFGFTVRREFQDRSFEVTYEGRYEDGAIEGSLTAGEGRFTAKFTGARAAGD